MIIELVKCILSFGIITLSGSLIYFLILRRPARCWMEAVTYGWGAGIAGLYMVGGVLVRIRLLAFRWQYLYLSFAALLAAGFLSTLWLWRRRNPGPASDEKPARRIQLDLWSILMLLLILVHACILLWINLNHPAFDSDATNSTRWAGLAKEIYRSGSLVPATKTWYPIYPSLIPLMANALTDRWFDSLAALPWFVFYACFIMISCRFIWLITGEIKKSLAYGCVLVTIPILSIHAIRPGFSDLILCYFVASVLIHLFNSYYYRNKRHFFLSLVFMAGACMTKQEGVAWMTVVYTGYGLLYAYEKGRLSMRRIILSEMSAAGVVLVLFSLGAGYLHTLVAGRSGYLRTLSYFQFSPAALEAMAIRVFTWGTFGIYWYLVLALLAYLLIFSQNGLYKLACVQIVLLFGLLLFFFCATGNVRFTLAGTNVSRLLMQWVPLGGLLLVMWSDDRRPSATRSVRRGSA